MNLLFTSAGRRGYMLEFFRQAMNGNGTIHAANSEAITSAFLYADKSVVSPLIYSPDYVGFILEYCLENNIDGIIPLFDIDIPILADAADRFLEQGVTLVASSAAVARICNDKIQTNSFLLANGFATPLTYLTIEDAREALDRDEVSFPLVVKPRWGMGSIGLYFADDSSELEVFYKKSLHQIERTYLKFESSLAIEESVMIQQCLDGVEFGLDVVNDLNGKHVTTFAKQKLAMRAGETDIAVTVDDAQLLEIGDRLGAILGHVGNLDVDLIRVGEKIYVFELNARFGGGYPFSHVAGADVPKAIVAWLQGETPDPSILSVKPGVLCVKDIAVRKFNG